MDEALAPEGDFFSFIHPSTHTLTYRQGNFRLDRFFTERDNKVKSFGTRCPIFMRGGSVAKGLRPNGAARVAVLMEALCASPSSCTIRELEALASLPRSTIHRLLVGLEEQGWVLQDPVTQGYRVGLRFHLLSNRGALYDALIRTAAPSMRRLMKATGNTAILSVLEGDRGYCIHTEEPPVAMKFTACRGTPVPLHAGATGKVLLAHAPRYVLHRVLARPLLSPRDGTPLDRSALEADLKRIRRQGFASSREEWMPHVGDVSVPLCDELGVCVAQLGVAGVAENIFEQLESTVRLLKETAGSLKAEISTGTGSGGGSSNSLAPLAGDEDCD